MDDDLRPLIIIILVLGALAYLGGIIWAGILSLQSTPAHPLTMPEPVTDIVTGIGATLATYFGAVLGISQSRHPRKKRQQQQQPSETSKPHPLLPQAVAYDVPKWAWYALSPHHTFYKVIQTIAVYFYFLSLVLAGIFWVIALARQDIPADILKNMGSALIGVFVGVFSIVLNTQEEAT